MRVPTTQLSYAELVQLAERQRRQIDTNRAQMLQKEARIRLGATTARSNSSSYPIAANNRVKALRHEVAIEEAELNRLRQIQVTHRPPPTFCSRFHTHSPVPI